MLSTILQKNNGATMLQINPKGVGIRCCPLKIRNLLGNLTILVDRV
jgi:hypothetical protein